MYMKNKKLLVSALLGISTLAIGAVVGIAAGKKSGFRAYADPVEPEWHHYHAQNPSLNWQNKATNKGTKEYWVQCGGGYQYTVPDSDNKVYETGAPDTSEFAADDDRWVTYCDLNGHNYDAKGVCAYCNELQNATKVIDKALANSKMSDEAAPLGFTSVYTLNGMSNGPCGYSQDVSGCDVLYFSLYSTASTTIAFGGNNGVNPVLFANDWYNILLTKDENGWVANYKKAYEVNWNTDHTKVDENTSTSFYQILRLYNWDGALSTATIKCTEVQTAHTHTPDSRGICTSCLELVGGQNIGTSIFSTVLEPNNNPAAPAGFTQSNRSIAHHNTDSCVSSISGVNAYSKIYFAIYSPYNFQLFSGNGKSFWTNRWCYFYMENVSETWHAYGRLPDEADFTELTIDSQSSNWKWLFKIVSWDSSGADFEVFATELIVL